MSSSHKTVSSTEEEIYTMYHSEIHLILFGHGFIIGINVNTWNCSFSMVE